MKDSEILPPPQVAKVRYHLGYAQHPNHQADSPIRFYESVAYTGRAGFWGGSKQDVSRVYAVVVI